MKEIAKVIVAIFLINCLSLSFFFLYSDNSDQGFILPYTTYLKRVEFRRIQVVLSLKYQNTLSV